MNPNRLLLPALLCLSLSASAQRIDYSLQLKNGSIPVEKNLEASRIDSLQSKLPRFKNKAFVVIQFDALPGESTRKLLSANGIELLEYIPNLAYTATVNGRLNASLLQGAGARAVVQLAPAHKMHQYLAQGRIPSWAVKAPGMVDCWVSFPKTFSAAEVLLELQRLNIDLISSDLQAYRILHIRVPAGRLQELASLPFIEYLQPAPPQDQPLNQKSRAASRANQLNASVADGGRGLNGEGVVVGVGDNADVQTHVDFKGRLISRAASNPAGHGHHVTGTVAGAGNINDMYRGYAPRSTVISQVYSGLLVNTPVYVQDYGMVITNNSYGNIIECDYHGTYDLYSRLLDEQAFDLPSLQHVFAAGNSGTVTCPPFSTGFRTVLGGYQTAKNVLTVGGTTDSSELGGFSSRGPVKDGRLKPEITAMGHMVASTWPNNGYSYNGGTSMAAPAVSGGLALLYQRYRQMNAGANPKSALMKALVCNGASDRGNNGPDYSFGFGWLNLMRSIDMLDNNRYFTTDISNGQTITHSITVPANTAQLKVMLYWHDPAGSLVSAQALVNDLDLEVDDPSSATILPRILNPAPGSVNTTATTGADHINNMEQVVIDNPAAGTYTLRIKGTAITQNPTQEYFVVYDPVPVQLKVTAPAGGDAFNPTTSEHDYAKIVWEADGYSSGTVRLDYSIDNGANWIAIASGLNINRRFYTWFVPNVSSGQVRVRVTKEGSGENSISNPFTITGWPVVTAASTQCKGYFSINWTPVSDPAATYDVMILQGTEMVTVASVPNSQTSYTFGGLHPDSVYFVTVRASLAGRKGRRAVAISRTPNSGTCSGAISDNDLRLNAIVSPVTGRRFTSSQPGAAAAVTVRIENLDDAPISSFNVSYSVNGGSWVTENVSATIAAGATYDHIFTSTIDLSATGTYDLVAVVKNTAATDNVIANDTLARRIKHLDNQPLNLASAFLDNIESAPARIYMIDTLGLDGLDRYDFENSTIYGRLRSFVNTGIAYSGSKALTLDADRLYNPGNTNYLYGTFNLSGYNTTANDLRFDFQFNQHGQLAHPNNKLWIRGSDTQPWIEAYDLDDNQDDPGQYKRSASIELSDLLTANGQSFTSSFQVRWGQYGQIQAVDRETAAGYTFDDIRVYEVMNDMQMISIDTPVSASCGLNATVPVEISVRNSSGITVSNVPVRYRINNGAWQTGTIPSIGPDATVQYTFPATGDFSAYGTYTVEAVAEFATDNFRDNDTLVRIVTNTPVVSSFPYLENFEAGNGYWHADGRNSSWQYGTPVSTRINRAASGTKAWKTNLEANHNDNESSYLYSPCFDIAGMTTPTLSFSLALDLEDCGTTLCDGAWVEYSLDGITWTKLGASGSGTNWYNSAPNQVWSVQNYTRWHVATIPLPTGINRLRLRFAMHSDPYVSREGIAIDDIHIYDNTKGIYNGSTMGSPVTQTVSGSSWIDFESGGKLIASIQPNGQNLGSTDVKAYIHSGAVRSTSTQYYHNRNITIKPAVTSPADSVTVRFYFLDSETEALINATGCAGCTKPASAYHLGVSKYSDSDDSFENGTIIDNNQGSWSFILPAQAVKVPFDRGYYAEFKVKDFSEFWLNNGGFDRATPLPVQLMEFTAQRSGSDVLVKWTTAQEENVSHYEIEVARGNEDMQANRFSKAGEVASLGNSTAQRNYSFPDREPNKSGVRYYRLKMIDNDGSFRYSPVRPVIFGETTWQIYPNPSDGLFTLSFQLGSQEKLGARIYDTRGRLVKQYDLISTGFPQKLSIDLREASSGVYLLEVGGRSFRLYKN